MNVKSMAGIYTGGYVAVMYLFGLERLEKRCWGCCMTVGSDIVVVLAQKKRMKIHE